MKTKNDLKKEYKLRKPKMGVFQIRNTINNKIFIESSLDLVAIWNRHRMQLQMGNHHNAALQKEWNEMGEAAFQYEILAEVEPVENGAVNYKKEIKLLEKLFIEELHPYHEKGYH